ncbi:hypothetical protein [Streptomyces cyaneofuscatus]|uniref:hypothetical protein n=1 Tax=Streptomyces cyaneofuscatus TaxID=66883 RepID=UPI0034317FC9
MITDGVTGTAAPDTYRAIPVPLALDGEWNGMTGYWFRRGVEEARAAWEVKERHLRCTIADEIHNLRTEMRECDGTWPDEYSTREVSSALEEAANIAVEGRPDGQPSEG